MRHGEQQGSWERLLPAAGPVFTALMVLGAAGFPAPPGADVSPAAEPTWLAAHRNAVIGQSYIRAFAAVAFVVLAISVASALRRATPGRAVAPTMALAGGVLYGALILLAQGFILAAALLSKAGGGTDAIRALGSANSAVLDFSALPAVLLFAAAGLGALHTDMLPRWLTILSLIGVPLAVVDALSYDGGPLEAVGLIGLVFFLAWSVLVGVGLLRGSQGEPERVEEVFSLI